MNLARTAAVAVTCLGLGVALGLVLGGGGATSTARLPDASVPVERDPQPETASTHEQDPDGTPVRSPRVRVEAVVEVSDLVERAVASIETPEIPTGDGRIDGRVTTREGAPLADVEVTVAMVGERSPVGRAWNDLSIAEQVTLTVQRRRLTEASTRTTMTDLDGRYAFENLPREPHTVVGRAEHYRISFDHGYRGRAEPDATVDMVGDPTVKLRVALTLADGTEPDSATVALETGGGGSMGLGWSPANRAFDVQPGTYRLVVSTGEFKEVSASVPSLTLTHGETPDEIALQLLSLPGIAGRVVLPAGAPTNWVSVGAELIGADTTPEAVAAGRARTNVNQHDAYRFAIPDLPSGRYLLVAWDQSQGGVLASREVEVGDEMAIVELTAAPPDRADHLEIVLHGPDGSPLSVAQVQLRFKGNRRNSNTGRPALPQPDGSLWVRHMEASRASGEGTYTVSVTHPSFGTIEAEYRPGPAARVAMQFAEPCFVEISVAGASPEALAAGLTATASGSAGSVTVDAAGHARLGPAQPGEVTVAASITSGRNSIRLVEQSLQVRGPETRATLPIPSLHTLRVEWADASAGAGQSVRVRRKERPGISLHQNAPDTGRVVFRFLPNGTYEVRAGNERKEITLPGTDLVRF